MNEGRDPLRAAIYARVSSDGQKEKQTIASQVAALEERVRGDGLAVEDEMRFLDDGYSGSALIRPALERLRDSAAQGALDRLYVHSPDRLARRYAHQFLLLEELQRQGVEVIFLNRPTQRNPEDELLLQVQGVIAEYERAKILERCRRGRRHAAQCGQVAVLGRAPYGYRYVSKHEGHGAAAYQPIDEEAQVVRQIFTWVGQERCSLTQVCQRLSQAGIATPSGKRRWGRTSVWSILGNPAYRGTAVFGKRRIGPARARLRPARGQPEHPRRAGSAYTTPAEEWILIPVPALIDADLFVSVQEQLAENRRRQRQSLQGARYLLQGLLVCQTCGYAWCGRRESQGRHRYYRCLGSIKARFGGQRVCQGRPIGCDRLDQAVWNDVCALLLDPHKLQEEYERRWQNSPSETGPTRSAQALLHKVKRTISRLIDGYTAGLIDKSEFEPRIRQARGQFARCEAEARAQVDRQAQQQELKMLVGRLQDFADHVKNGLQNQNWHKQREIIRMLVKRIDVDKETFRVIYRVSLPPFTKPPERDSWQDCSTRFGGRRG